jgi:hypothetical protein
VKAKPEVQRSKHGEINPLRHHIESPEKMKQYFQKINVENIFNQIVKDNNHKNHSNDYDNNVGVGKKITYSIHIKIRLSRLL